MELKEIVRSIRGDQTQERFAASIGTTRNSVIAWEQGKLKPSADFMQAMGITTKYELDSPTRPGTEALPVACDPASEGGYERT